MGVPAGSAADGDLLGNKINASVNVVSSSNMPRGHSGAVFQNARANILVVCVCFCFLYKTISFRFTCNRTQAYLFAVCPRCQVAQSWEVRGIQEPEFYKTIRALVLENISTASRKNK